MGQVRAMKIGFEARLKCKVSHVEWITELAGALLSRGQVGKDGPNSVIKIVRQKQGKAVLEIGEQVVAKPLRGL